MSRRAPIALVVISSLFVLGACAEAGEGGEQEDGATSETKGDGDGDGDGEGDGDGDGDGDPGSCAAVPTNAAELEPWLAGGGYQQWLAESGVHDSAGPHFGGVRTFVDPCLGASLEAGEAEHPPGAAAVKELYGSGDLILGWALMVKTEAGAGGDGWYWYELYEGSVFADGTGVGICVNCHDSGADHILSPWPLQ